MTFTAQETRIIRMVSRPWWPSATLYCLLGLVACGISALGIAVVCLVRLFHTVHHMEDSLTEDPEFLSLLSESWVGVLIGGISLMCSIPVWGARRFGLLIRKLGVSHDAN